MTAFAQKASDNDISVENGDFVMCKGREAYANVIADAVRTLLGEIQLDTTVGTDYLGTVFDSVMKQAEWRSNVEEIILRFPFVVGISSFDMKFDGNGKLLSYTAVIQTDDGEIKVGE